MKRLKKTLIFENRRNHLQVLSDILELCGTPQAKTCILRTTNTSFKLLENYLLQLQTSGLLELQGKPKRYMTTMDGQKFIDTWEYLKRMLYPESSPRIRNGKYTVQNRRLDAVSLKAVQVR